jgi:hypothetical protein
MGGDGGVIASNRKYMRGAGTADHTADASRQRGEQASEKEIVQELMALCYLTKVPLNFKDNQIVADPYGRLYHKEAVVEALIRRKQQESDELGIHIRGLKDLQMARFELSANNKPICPVTSVELNGINPAFLIPHRKDGGENVLSDRALKEMGKEALREEYGDLEDLLRLAPPPTMMEEIQANVRAQHEQERTEKAARNAGKKDKKRKQTSGGEEKKIQTKQLKGSGVSNAARQRVQSAVESNEVLSSLFTTKRDVSLKQRADNLFAINQA